MAIQIPGQRTTLSPISSNTPQVPQEGGAEAGISSALAQAGSTVAQISDAQRARRLALEQKRNAQLVMQAESDFNDLVRQHEIEVRENRRGTGALGATADSEEWFTNTLNDFTANLANDAVRGAFMPIALREREQVLNQVALQESQEGDKVLIGGAEAAISNFQQKAGRRINDPNAIAESHAGIVEHVNLIAVTQQLDEDQKAELLLDSLSDMHRQVFDAMNDVDPRSAKAYFEANGEEMKDHGYYTSAVEQADYRLASQEFTDQAFAAIKRGEMSFDTARAEARANLSGQAEDHALGLIDAEQNRQQKRDAEEQKAWNDVGTELFVRNRDIRTIPESILNKMDPALVLSLRNQERIGPEDTRTDWGLRQQLISAATENPEEFARTDLTIFYDRLNLREQTEMQKIQTDVRNGLAEPFLTTAARLNNATTNLGLDPEEAARFDRTVQVEIEARRAAGERITPQVVDEVVNQNAAKVNFDSWFPFDERDVTLSELRSNPDANFFERYSAESITLPPDETERITAALEAGGIDVNPTTIRNYFMIEKGLNTDNIDLTDTGVTPPRGGNIREGRRP